MRKDIQLVFEVRDRCGVAESDVLVDEESGSL
jgi:hypothetical protein